MTYIQFSLYVVILIQSLKSHVVLYRLLKNNNLLLSPGDILLADSFSFYLQSLHNILMLLPLDFSVLDITYWSPQVLFFHTTHIHMQSQFWFLPSSSTSGSWLSQYSVCLVMTLSMILSLESCSILCLLLLSCTTFLFWELITLVT